MGNEIMVGLHDEIMGLRFYYTKKVTLGYNNKGS
jgi:hypothetical protein